MICSKYFMTYTVRVIDMCTTLSSVSREELGSSNPSPRNVLELKKYYLIV